MFELAIPARIGILPLDADASVAEDERIRATMTAGISFPESLPGLGDYPSNKPSDALNFFTLETVRTGAKILPRGGWGSWANCVPMIKEKDGWRPLADPGTPDRNFKHVHPTIFGNPNPPIGAVALITATTGHGKRQLVGVMAGSSLGVAPIISDWRSDRPPAYSTHIADMNGPNIDPARHAGFHTFTKIQLWADPCSKYADPNPRYVVALNGTAAADKVGLLYTHFAGADALLSFEGWGPLRYATSTHEVGSTKDGPIRSGAIDTEALYTGGAPGYDMPLPFEERDEDNPVYDGFEYRVKLWRRTKWVHEWLCGKRPYRWDLHTRVPVTATPKCTPTKVPNKDSTGTPDRIYPVANAVYNPGFTMNQGQIFVPRPGLLYGKFPRAA
jgi:hypothetical protein